MINFHMPQRPIRHILTVVVPKGLIIRDRPSPQSAGAQTIRAVGVGMTLYAYGIFNVGPVPYAELVPEDPNKLEFVRVREADSSIVYVSVYDLPGVNDTQLLLERIATALETLASRK